ncbi:hypothetical protein Dxin01_00350 [Deinococcus xinjiangensis]|uniref:Intracellular proteinase inhibitor BsuPI domain-containing protein n=1 Tax=Deinococcus xinjiangensis TaxID=457454 RepID=A0ABP9V9E4_9DEIO
MSKRTLPALFCALLGLAVAQEIPAAPPADSTGVPIMAEPAPLPPVNVPVTMVLPAALDGVTANLKTANAEAGGLRLTLTLSSTLGKSVELLAPRDNRQECAFAPSVRVLKVGTREVVYPNGSGNAMLCAQDMSTQQLKAGGSVAYSRTLNLPAGEYMIESWFLGSADGMRVKVPAQPVRVAVK